MFSRTVACSCKMIFWRVGYPFVMSINYAFHVGHAAVAYWVNLRIDSKYGKLRTRKISVFGHFSPSAPFAFSLKGQKLEYITPVSKDSGKKKSSAHEDGTTAMYSSKTWFKLNMKMTYAWSMLLNVPRIVSNRTSTYCTLMRNA